MWRTVTVSEIRSVLDLDSLPMRLFAGGNTGFWNPADFDFSQDAEDFARLDSGQRAGIAYLAAMFVVASEAGTKDIRPFMTAVSAEGRLGDEMYLTQFCFEEAKHAEVLRRWLDSIGVRADFSSYVRGNAAYQRIFFDELPTVLAALDRDPSPANQIRASVTYNHIIEGTLQQTGYYLLRRVTSTYGIMPGLHEMLRRISQDEHRHLAWGTFTCRRHIAADDRNWDVARDRMAELLPYAVRAIEWSEQALDPLPFGVDLGGVVRQATRRAGERLAAIERARGLPVGQVDLDLWPELLEDRLGAEDDAELACPLPR
jgi:ribonucleoside-diphosphate reductase beta chain